jgi:hypothetical protein
MGIGRADWRADRPASGKCICRPAAGSEDDLCAGLRGGGGSQAVHDHLGHDSIANKGPRATGSTFGQYHRARNQQPQLPRRGAPKALGPAARRPGSDPRPEGRGHGRSVAGGAAGSASRQCRGRRRATAVGWRDRLESDARRGRRRSRWATEPQQIPSAGTWIWSSISAARTWPICPAAPAGCSPGISRARKPIGW